MQSILRKNYARHERMWVKTTMRNYYFMRLNIESRFRVYRCVMGHFGYGIHRHIHNECEYFTMLRDPVQRFISSYFFAFRDEFHGRNGRRKHKLVTAENMSIEEYLERGMARENVQTRQLAGLDKFYHQGDFKSILDEGDLALAKKNLLEQIGVVGIMEQFDESLILLQKRYNWKDVSYVRKNVSHNKNKDISERIIELIREKNRFDVELYRFAKELMKKQIDDYHGDFVADLNKLKMLNTGMAQ